MDAESRTCTCGAPLGPRVDGEHHRVDDVEVCAHCYYEGLSKLLDEHPIGCARPIR